MIILVHFSRDLILYKKSVPNILILIFVIYIEDFIENKQIKLYYINRKKNPTNILIKNIG